MSYLLLALGSAVVFVLIVLDCLRAYGRKTTLAFFGGVFAYGIARHALVWWATLRDFGSVFPYQFVRQPVQILGISPQELVGWAIVAYLGWQLSERILKEGGIAQVVYGSFIFICCTSLAIETTAIASQWWVWNIPLGTDIFGKVPYIGIIDWGIVAVECLTPFLIWFHARRLGWAFWLSLGILPVHMAFHHTELMARLHIPWIAQTILHFLIPFVLACLALFPRRRFPLARRPVSALPDVAVGIVAGVLVIVQIGFLHAGVLGLSLLPLAAFYLLARAPAGSLGISVLAAGAPWRITLLPAAFPYAFMKALTLKGALPRILLLGVLVILKTVNVVQLLEQNARYQTFMKEAQRAVDGRNLPEAETWFRKAVEADPGYPGTYYDLATCLRLQNKWEEASANYKRILEIQEFHAETAKLLISSYLILNRDQDALHEASELLRIHPEEPYLNYQMGAIQQRLGNRKAAIRYFIEALSLTRPGKDPLLYMQTLASVNHRAAAVRLAYDTLSKNPADHEIALFLEKTLKEEGRIGEIVAFYDALARGAGDPFYIFKVGDYALQAGNYQLAWMAYQSILNKEPMNPAALEKMEDLKKLAPAFSPPAHP